MQTQDKVLPVDIGIETKPQTNCPRAFSSASDTYSLYLKTHYFHWNVTGSLFHSLHQMFEEQYTEQLWPLIRLPKGFVHWDTSPWVLQRVYRIKLNQRDGSTFSRDMVPYSPKVMKRWCGRLREAYLLSEETMNQPKTC